jgi:hypothetical protein
MSHHGAALPLSPGIGTLQELHFREDKTELLGMASMQAAMLHPGIGRR